MLCIIISDNLPCYAVYHYQSPQKQQIAYIHWLQWQVIIDELMKEQFEDTKGVIRNVYLYKQNNAEQSS
jgi:hypothetical protein